MATRPKRLTTVSYTILGLLGIREHTPYELARQVDRLAVFWTSATSVVYEEPKHLVAHGLATARTEATGRRTRTVYAITEDGRAALADWLAVPVDGGPQVQFEALLRVLFADAGTTQQVLAAITAIRLWAEATKANGEAISADYLDGDPPYPARAHIVSLTMGYQMSFVRAVLDWADWAEVQVDGWDGTGGQRSVDLDVFARVVAGRRPLGDQA